jgi:hypothetical protein
MVTRTSEGGPSGPSVFELLDAEWQQLRTDRAAARHLQHVCDLAGARNLAELEHHVRGADPAAADRILLALVTRTIDDDDPLAARVLLQMLLPGTRNLARRWWSLGDDDERAAAAVAAVYGRIRRYPLARRPGKIAANVLLDAARDLRRAVPPTATFAMADPTVLVRDNGGADLPVGAAAELAEVLSDAVAAGMLQMSEARLIAQTRIAGARIADIATHTQIGRRTLWDRRQRAEQRLASRAACA